MSTFQSKGATFIMIKAVNKYYQQNDKDAKKLNINSVNFEQKLSFFETKLLVFIALPTYSITFIMLRVVHFLKH